MKIISYIGKFIDIVPHICVFLFFSLLIYALTYPFYIQSLADVGMTKSEVVEKFRGKRIEISSEPYICGSQYWKNFCEESEAMNVHEFLISKTGVDGVFVIGFDINGVVVITRSGDT